MSVRTYLTRKGWKKTGSTPGNATEYFGILFELPTVEMGNACNREHGDTLQGFENSQET